MGVSFRGRQWLLSGVCAGVLAVMPYHMQYGAVHLSEAHALTNVTAEMIFKAVDKKQWTLARTLASNSGNRAIMTAVQWYYLTQSNDAMDADELADFVEKHPDFPLQDKLHLRAELALISNNHSNDDLKAWFAKHPPVTSLGKLKLAEINDKIDMDTVINAWVEGNFTDNEYARIISKYGTAIDAKAYAARVNRLLWDNQISNAQPLLVKLTPAQQALAMARIALQKNAPDAASKVQAVPSSLQADEGLLYDRLQWRVARQDMKGVEELLLSHHGKDGNYPEKWWPARKRAVREALNEGRYTMAAKLAHGHGISAKNKESREALSEALFLTAWIDLVFMKKADDAYADFKTLFESVKFPISSSRAAYWAARAAKAAKKPAEEVTHWYQVAAMYPTHFYGQIAYEYLHQGAPLALPAEPVTTKADRAQFIKDYPLASLVSQLCAQDVGEYTMPFLRELARAAKSPKDAALAAQLSTCTNRQDIVLRTTKEVWQEHAVMMTSISYPTLQLPKNMPLELEPALAFAITRQESMFYPKAESSAGAKGLMQIMPNTGKLVAKKHGIPFAVHDLFQPVPNLRLGTAYLADLLAKMNGSYVMAVAGYNAGPSRPLSWAAQYGRPNGNLEQTLNWIEMIPFNETRNYVMRVLENYHVYRSLLSNQTTPLTAHKIASH
jgi:soluble lytic murein transglycosylase